MKKVQPEKSIAPKTYNMNRVQHEETRIKTKHETVQRERSEWTTTKVQHKRGAT